MPSARIAAASEKICNASVSVRSRMMTFRQIARSAITTTDLNLHDAVRALRHDKKGLLEFERDYHREDHAEHSLEDRVVGGVEAAREQKSEQDFSAEAPDSRDHHDRNQRRQDQDHQMFESLVDGQKLELCPGCSQLIPDQHR